MTAILKVDTIQDTSGNNIINESSDTITIGASGDTIALAGTTVTGITQGITVADQWRLTTNLTGVTAQFITANLEQIDSSGQGTLGSAMTESSGVFTFPSTGIYLVNFTAYLEGNDDSRYNSINIEGTINNSSYVNLTESSQFHQSTQSNTAYSGVHCQTYVDVTDTTNVKVRFKYTPATSNITLLGATNYSASHVQFIRLGDT
mgnify:CR=1 FL=1